ncbi:Nucleoporin NUP170 [Nosema bombycis CQ1]|uniref:Nucleoporin NUP170 n=1 Tax=Nosema bombycis (strain CQ1 / CVCC 102059) TaxID=578461 RepID=R0KR14_NOSB1|nr:Nucleoporin NUP170 [Nosema bombycis CQ1]|eukprot:EOB13176.1 Nucleoporin NUP170 [Nosema bombycis CQ1]
MNLCSIIKIQNPFLEKFLLDKSQNDNDPRIFELHWKYLAYRNERIKAAKSLIYLAGNKKESLEQRVDLLEKARTVSLHTEIENEIKTRFELLDIQKNLIEKGVKDPIITNVLLSADELFNDYAYKYPSLALKIISISNFTDKNVIKNYWIEGMKGDFRTACNFLLNNKLDGTVMDLEIISSILIEKLKNGDELGKILLEAGFNFYDIKKMIQTKIKKENHPIIRNILIENLNLLIKEESKNDKIEKVGITSGY